MRVWFVTCYHFVCDPDLALLVSAVGSVAVKIKWGTTTFDNVEVDAAQGIDTFRAQVFALTSVPIDRQKVLCKGKMIADGVRITNRHEVLRVKLSFAGFELSCAPCVCVYVCVYIYIYMCVYIYVCVCKYA